MCEWVGGWVGESICPIHVVSWFYSLYIFADTFFFCLGSIIGFCAYLCTHDAIAHSNPDLGRYTAAAVTARYVCFSPDCCVGSSSSYCRRSRRCWHDQAHQEEQTRAFWERWRDHTVDACSRSWDGGWWKQRCCCRRRRRFRSSRRKSEAASADFWWACVG